MTNPYNPELFLPRAIPQKTITQNYPNPSQSSKLTWGKLCLDQMSGKVTYDQQVIRLTATEYNLLELFLQHPNRIFSRRAILDQLWEFDNAPIEHAVTTHIKDLRKKLKAGGLAEEILETVYGMGYRLQTPPTPKVTPATKDITNICQVIQHFRHSFNQQIEVLEQVKVSLLAGNWHEELQQIAKNEAHKLAGSMGIFGYLEGSRLAKALEHLLSQHKTLTNNDIAQFCQLVAALQQELTKLPTVLPTELQALPNHRILVIDDDALLKESLLAQASSWGMEMNIVPDLAAARSYLTTITPEAVVLDLSFPATQEDGLTLLQELANQLPDLPIVVFTGRDSLAERLAVSNLGGRLFLSKPATIEQIFLAITHVLHKPPTPEPKVLIVDDDPLILAEFSTLLTPWGLKVTTLPEPEQFWAVLMDISPDLVVLDLEMPIVNGLELCRVLRQDVKWRDLLILMVTSYTDMEFLQQAFAAGADDFITKPVLGPELVTRVISRIERAGRRKKI